MNIIYPWLNILYKNILSFYSNFYHTILLSGCYGNFEDVLCYNITKYLLCYKPKKFKSCNSCLNCKLFLIGNCPDFYRLYFIKKSSNLIMNKICNIINTVRNSSHQDGFKVIWISNFEYISNYYVNSLLKIIEEPPKNTFFIISCINVSYLSPIIVSRCVLWFFPNLCEDLSVYWLWYYFDFCSLISRITLRICGKILNVKLMLMSMFWRYRILFCKILYKSIFTRNVLLLLPILTMFNNDWYLYCLLSFISDSLKWKSGIFLNLINYDYFKLIRIISKSFKFKVLSDQWQDWCYYLRKKNKVKGLNSELLILNQLIKWNKKFYYLF